MLGHEGVKLMERQRVMEAALNSSSILPDHHALLGMTLTQFRPAEAGILAFLGLPKGFEVCIFIKRLLFYFMVQIICQV